MAKKRSQPAPQVFQLQVRQPTQITQIDLPQFRATGNSPVAQTIQTSQARAAAGILRTRGGVNLGPMGYMPNELVLALEMDIINFTQYQAFVKFMLRDLQESQILHVIQTSLYEPLRQALFQLINTEAPKDSGRLRNAMELSVAGGRGGQGGSHSMTSSLHPFFVVLNTGRVEYAPVVNQMSTPVLQHFGTSHQGRLSKRFGRTVTRRPGQTQHPLFDPQAITYWYESILDKGRLRAQQLWANLSGNGGPLANLMQPVVDYYAQLQPVLVFVTPSQVIQTLFTVRFG